MNAPVAWLALQQLLDSALPIGGFSHSFGLETLVQEGRVRTSEQLEAYTVTMMMQSWAPADAMIIKAVYNARESGHWEETWHVERLVHVQRLAVETRSGMEKMGRRLIKLSEAVFPQLDMARLSSAAAERETLGTYPLVYGYLCAELNISLEQAVQGYMYNCIVTSIGSALRLMSIGQTEGQAIIARCAAQTPAAWEMVRGMQPQEAWSNMPLVEIAMIRHETLYSRLFMS
ncbi:urease accessory protein UreF [Paenibacillus daejeonensis]|uniref:urease accessory protein UreF n=1 Tax=Paenibacillus daejeonensis TaxID=135193 RepID=UPI00037882DE|nr:urease accessory UreF family protein [Paenibacillus daejeonensis]